MVKINGHHLSTDGGFVNLKDLLAAAGIATRQSNKTYRSILNKVDAATIDSSQVLDIGNQKWISFAMARNISAGWAISSEVKRQFSIERATMVENGYELTPLEHVEIENNPSQDMPLIVPPPLKSSQLTPQRAKKRRSNFSDLGSPSFNATNESNDSHQPKKKLRSFPVDTSSRKGNGSTKRAAQPSQDSKGLIVEETVMPGDLPSDIATEGDGGDAYHLPSGDYESGRPSRILSAVISSSPPDSSAPESLARAVPAPASLALTPPGPESLALVPPAPDSPVLEISALESPALEPLAPNSTDTSPSEVSSPEVATCEAFDDLVPEMEFDANFNVPGEGAERDWMFAADDACDEDDPALAVRILTRALLNHAKSPGIWSALLDLDSSPSNLYRAVASLPNDEYIFQRSLSLCETEKDRTRLQKIRTYAPGQITPLIESLLEKNDYKGAANALYQLCSSYLRYNACAWTKLAQLLRQHKIKAEAWLHQGLQYLFCLKRGRANRLSFVKCLVNYYMELLPKKIPMLIKLLTQVLTLQNLQENEMLYLEAQQDKLKHGCDIFFLKNTAESISKLKDLVKTDTSLMAVTELVKSYMKMYIAEESKRNKFGINKDYAYHAYLESSLFDIFAETLARPPGKDAKEEIWSRFLDLWQQYIDFLSNLKKPAETVRDAYKDALSITPEKNPKAQEVWHSYVTFEIEHNSGLYFDILDDWFNIGPSIHWLRAYYEVFEHEDIAHEAGPVFEKYLAKFPGDGVGWAAYMRHATKCGALEDAFKIAELGLEWVSGPHKEYLYRAYMDIIGNNRTWQDLEQVLGRYFDEFKHELSFKIAACYAEKKWGSSRLADIVHQKCQAFIKGKNSR